MSESGEHPPAEGEAPSERESEGEAPGERESALPRHRLDPDRAAAAAAARSSGQPAPADAQNPGRPAAGDARAPGRRASVIDTRRYRWMIGIFGLALVIAASVYQFAKRGIGTPGVAAGARLHYFVAPLATSDTNLDANTNPRCDPAHPNPVGLNVCGRTPLVLGFFVTGSDTCRREVDALQHVSRRYPSGAIQFAAVAIRAGRSDTAALARSRHWTIPVAYDRDGAIGEVYGVQICPIIELAYRGGIVADRLIGEQWLNSSALASRVQRLLH